MKVIVAGYPKTGTKSINAALTQLGYSVYDALENLVFLQDEYIAILNKGWSTEDFRRMYENVDAIADMPAFYFWDEIHKAFPDAKIVLTIREDEDAWWKSVKNQIRASDQLLPRVMEMLSPTFNRSRKEIWCISMFLMFGSRYRHPLSWRPTVINEQMARKCYRAHNAYVMQARMRLSHANRWRGIHIIIPRDLNKYPVRMCKIQSKGGSTDDLSWRSR